MSNKVATKKTLIYGCLHTPYQDEKAYSAMLSFAKYWKPDVVVENGDINDHYSISSHKRDPKRSLETQAEVDEARECNSRIRRAVGKDTEILRVLGNHGFRHASFISKCAPEYAYVDDFQYESVFRLGDTGIKVVNDSQYGGFQLSSMVTVGHFKTLGPESGQTATRLLRKHADTIIDHHSHRLAQVYRRFPNGREITGVEGGCLCTLNPDWVDSPDWQHGFVIMQELERGRFFITPIPIVGGEILYDGRLF
jgi:predicted phosphodiesterase